jgi:hypothetical protein
MEASPVRERDISYVTQLAAPRGVVYVDEISGRPAALKLTILGDEFFYSNHESLELDATVLDELAHHLSQIKKARVAADKAISAEERAIHGRRATALLTEAASLALDLAKRRLVASEYAFANPAALRSLKLLAELHGESVHLVPAYLVLAESCLGLGRYSQADGFVSSAELQLSKAPAALPEDLARLHMLKGKVSAARHDVAGALHNFSLSCVHAATAAGSAEHFTVAAGLYQLGVTFAAAGKWEAAQANYDLAVSVWYKLLIGVKGGIVTAVEGAAEEEEGGAGGGRAVEVARDARFGLPILAPAVVAEGLTLLAGVRGVRRERLGAEHVSVVEVLFTSALLTAAGGNVAAAAGMLEEAAPALLSLLVSNAPSACRASPLPL